MKASLFAISLAAACLLCGAAQAQYKAPRDYFPKNNPGPFNNGAPAGARNGGQANARNAPDKQQPAKPKFKDLPVNTQFYFLADTNRAFPWTKISSLSATNTKNGVVQTISGEALVQRACSQEIAVEIDLINTPFPFALIRG